MTDPMNPDDIPTEITRMTYRSTQAFSDAGLPILSQNQTAVLLAHYWPAIEQHIRGQVRAAALTEAAQVAGDIARLPGGAAYQAGYLDAREELAREFRRLAATPTAAPEA